MLAQIAQTTANFSFCAPKKPLTLEVFMPRAERQSAEEKQAQEQDLFTATFTNYLMTAKNIQERGAKPVQVQVPSGSTPEAEMEKIRYYVELPGDLYEDGYFMDLVNFIRLFLK